MEKYKMTAAEPHTFYWIYTTLFRPHYLNQKEREELLAITPILYMMFRKEHPFNSICDFE
ncbi:hypothetical protein FLA_0411 [Filimonas lacunae]|nr:hypothetical protein FLA_0411 [Filimonas lacunae]